MCKKALLSVVLSFITILTAFGQADFFDRLADSALTLTGQPVTYDPSYRSIDYPDGDIPSDRGVCSDVIIRAYRIVARRKSADGKRYQVVHNIGAGQVLEDMLFGYRIIGHYRYMG